MHVKLLVFACERVLKFTYITGISKSRFLLDYYDSIGYISITKVLRSMIWYFIEICIEKDGTGIHVVAPLIEVERI